ncbi:DUF2062 domain-containing protein [Puniceicoccaceae bacterium K14]|nr:DUF2062 domain-containing protein [Puniceicoccaceae bacterium K14]
MTTVHDEKIAEAARRKHRYSRIRRAKQILRPLPRRATLHRYPVLKFFAKAARQRPSLWSFKQAHISPALYIGCVLAFLPAYGVQIPIAILGAWVFKANLPLTVGLQFITNPFTMWLVYWFTFTVGQTFIDYWKLGGANNFLGAAYALVIGGIFVGLALALILDLAYRITMRNPKRKSVDVKRMLKK